MPKKYHVQLTDDERTELRTLTRKGTIAARKLVRAQALLHADAGLTDEEIAAALQIGTATVERLRKRFLEGGLASALHDRPRPGAQRKLDGKGEAVLVAWACSAPPDERPHWTMQLLADKLVELQIVETISDETVRRVLKKTTSSPG